MYEEAVHATGHENVSATHASTFEVTSDDYLTPAGDCILAVEADRTPADFDEAFVDACQDPDARITATIEADPDLDESNGSLTATVEGRGDPALTFENERSIVGRTSDYVDDRTVLVEADRAAADLPRNLVEALADGAELTLRLTVE